MLITFGLKNVMLRTLKCCSLLCWVVFSLSVGAEQKQVLPIGQPAANAFGLPDLEGPVVIHGDSDLTLTGGQLTGAAALLLLFSLMILLAWILRENHRLRQLHKKSLKSEDLSRELRELYFRSELALDSAQIGQFAVEVSQQRLIADERFKLLYGLSADADLGFNELSKYLHPDDREVIVDFRERAYGPIENGEERYFETLYRVIKAGSSEPHWLKVTAKRAEIDGEAWAFGCVYSIDQEVKAREQYKQVYDNLNSACRSADMLLLDTNLSTGVSRYIIGPVDTQAETLSTPDMLKAVPAEYHQALLTARSSVGVPVEYPLYSPGWSANWTRDLVVKRWIDERGEQRATILRQNIHKEYERRLDLERSEKLIGAASQAAGISLIDHNLYTHTAQWKFTPANDAETPYIEDRLLEATVPEYRDAVAQAHKTVGEVVQFPLEVAETGETKWIENQVFDRWVDVNGQLHQLVISKDLTEQHAKQQALEAALSAVELVTHSGGIGLLKHDLISDQLEVNSVFRDIFDFPQSDFPQLSFADFLQRLPKADFEQRKSLIEGIRQSRQYFKHEVEYERPDGTSFWCKVHLITRFEQDQPVEVSGSFIDVTEQRILASKLRTLLKEREAAVTALEKRQMAQQQMFAVIGHELRTPASALNMMLDAQAEDDNGAYSADIRSTAAHLLAVLDDLRAVIEPDVLTKREVSAGSALQVVEGALTALRDRIEQAGLRVDLQADAESAQAFLFDLRGLRQVTINLVKNAALHSGATELRVRLCIVKSETDKARLNVEFSDDGKGIPEDDWELMFEPFKRGNTDQDGTGLGLHICRELLQASGGDLRLSRSLAGGCRFILSLPLQTAESGSALVEEPVASLQNIRILLAEDNLTLRMLTQQILNGLGASTTVAVDGQEALEQLDKNAYDLLLTDIFMPRIDGFTLVKQLREQGFEKPIIGITAAMVGDESDRLVAAGADSVIPKPVTKEKLLKAWTDLQAERVS